MKPFIRYTGLAALCAAIAVFFSLFLNGCRSPWALGGEYSLDEEKLYTPSDEVMKAISDSQTPLEAK